jgi:hypothetical protein
MKHKFPGTYEELKRAMFQRCPPGAWSKSRNGTRVFRAIGGGVVNFCETNGSVWCQGEPTAKLVLEYRLRPILNSIPEPKDYRPR